MDTNRMINLHLRGHFMQFLANKIILIEPLHPHHASYGVSIGKHDLRLHLWTFYAIPTKYIP